MTTDEREVRPERVVGLQPSSASEERSHPIGALVRVIDTRRERLAKSLPLLVLLLVPLGLGYRGVLPSPVILIAATCLLVLGVLALQAATSTLLKAAAGFAVVPWTLQSVAGVPSSVARLPISAMVITGCVGILIARGSLPPPWKRTHARLPGPARAVVAATALLVFSTVLEGSISAAMPWAVGMGLLFALAGACRRGAITASQILASIVVSQAAVSTWDLVQRSRGLALLPSMATRATPVLENGAVFSRFAGSLGDYELYSEINAICLSAAVALALVAPSPTRRLAWLVAVVPLATAALATGTRGGVVVVVVALATMCVVGRNAWGLVGLTALAVPVAVLASGLAPFSRLSNLSTNQPLGRLLNRQGIWDSFTSRTRGQLWTPLGHGLNYPLESIGGYPHNLGLFLLYAGGFVGALAFLLAISWLGLSVCRLGFRGRSRTAIIVGPLLIAELLDQAKIEFVRLDSYVVTFFALLSVGVAVLVEPRRAAFKPARVSESSLPHR